MQKQVKTIDLSWIPKDITVEKFIELTQTSELVKKNRKIYGLSSN